MKNQEIKVSHYDNLRPLILSLNTSIKITEKLLNYYAKYFKVPIYQDDDIKINPDQELKNIKEVITTINED